VIAFRGELDAIARVARVSSEALSYRVVQLMRQLHPTALDEAAERGLRADLDRAGLRLTFRRPRPVLVRRALNHAVAELIDSGRIPGDALPALEELLRRSDPRLLRARPGSRPALIVPLERGDREYLRDKWTDAVNVGPSALLATPPVNGQLVLAEETQLHWLDWKRPTEVRIGVRVRGWPDAAVLRDDEPLKMLCERWVLAPSAEYLGHQAGLDALVVLQDGYKFDTPGRQWLAFNPAVARRLGWLPDEGGLFRWRDGTGSMMVESLWWEDGCPELRPPHPRDEVGSGWLVVASQLGAEAIRRTWGRLTACVRVDRSASDQPTRRASDQRLDE
jgi:hypothetical protein